MRFRWQIVEEEIFDLLGDIEEGGVRKKSWRLAENLDGLTKITLHDDGSSIVLKNVTELELETEEKLIDTFW